MSPSCDQRPTITQPRCNTTILIFEFLGSSEPFGTYSTPSTVILFFAAILSPYLLLCSCRTHAARAARRVKRGNIQLVAAVFRAACAGRDGWARQGFAPCIAVNP